MRYSKISFLLWFIVSGGQVKISRAGVEAPEHTLKKCLQHQDNTIICEDFIPETEEITSQWPAGPYVIPMTRHGCPESSMNGWREGYLSIKWVTAINVTRADLFSTSNKHMFISATPNYLKLRFCYKYKSNTSIDVGSWPEGNFSIYGTEDSCPQDFEKHFSNISLPDISRWDSDGYLPDFKIFDDATEDILQMQLCSRRTAYNSSAGAAGAAGFTPGTDLTPYWTSFFLIKDDNYSCPIFQNSVMREETMHLEQYENNYLEIMQVSDTLCYYEINTISDDNETWLLEERLKNAYSVYIASITNGNATASDFKTEDFLFPVNEYYHWKIVDLGRTVAVSAVDITNNTGNSEICNNTQFRCFISNGKWDFLYEGALLCHYVPVCRIGLRSVSLLFTRTMEGRYVALFFDDAYSEFEELIINVYTEHIVNGSSSSCNTDLGMSDLSIKDEHISASSSLPEYPANAARPYLSGWCPQFNDNLTYIQIEFPVITTIEGITVYRSPGMNVSFSQTGLLLYVEDFNTSSAYSKTLIIDTSRPDTHPQTFWFLKKIPAELVTIFIQEGNISTLMCLRFELLGCKLTETFQAFSACARSRQISPQEVVAFTSEIYEDKSIVTSINFQGHYHTNQAYNWIIRYPKFHFIKLVFRDIELNTRKKFLHENGADTDQTPRSVAFDLCLHHWPRPHLHVVDESTDNRISTCTDSLTISNSVANSNFARVIDNRYNGVKHAMTVATKEMLIVLSFVTCPINSPTNLGTGFRVIATHANIPACFSLRPHIPWHEGLQETCRQSVMLITPMSYLGFPFKHTNEQWTIHTPNKRVNVQLLHFYVPCQNEVYQSAFKIIDAGHEKSYCNIERPPDSFNSSFDTLTIYFFKGSDPWHKPNTNNIEGFQIIYFTILESEDRLIDYKDVFSKVRNVALNKPTVSSSGDVSVQEASMGNDGITFQEMSSGTCFSTYYELNPWWLVDLQNSYTLFYLVLHSEIGENTGDTFPMILSTGLTVWDIQRTVSICGKIETSRTINLDRIKARYVQLEYEKFGKLSLCEVQVYGELELRLAESSTKELLFPAKVHGEWGEWSSWTSVCHCGDRQFRHRLCDSPRPQFSGNSCPGKAISYRNCTPVTSGCEVYNEPETRTLCADDLSDDSGLSSWSEWSACSSECGHGLLSRKRSCERSGNTGSTRHCAADLVESRPCVGNKSCLVCSNTFRKCYCILFQVTNWNQARLECWRRNMTLVSILSVSEMRFIKYLLRERRYQDGPPPNYFDADFYVHIGLSLGTKLSYEVPTWENGFPATYFTAWKTSKFTPGHCTRMHFKLFDDDNTWENEDCRQTLAEYTMCDYKDRESGILPIKSLSTWVDGEMEEFTEQIQASEYDGDTRITILGEVCKNSTYCRFNKDLGYLACETADGIWNECSVKLPTRTNSNLVYKKYLGTLNKSFTGKLCQRWDTKYPHDHNIHGNSFKGEGISDAANYCRDPGNTGYLWCFTTDVETRWEPCLLEEIKAERRCTKNLKYSGKRNTTVTGSTCEKWDQHGLKNADFPEAGVADSRNYCRDPFSFGYNWCYVDSSPQWEPCIIEETQRVRKTYDISLENTTDYQLVCDDGRAIPEYFRCDGKFHCKDEFDETECLYSVHPMIKKYIETKVTSITNNKSLENGSFFKCKSREWISIIAKCDGVIDCFDASDETRCYDGNLGNNVCDTDQFQCTDGDCIHISQVCNFRDDCLDGSDEYCEPEQCSTLTEYQCNNGRCIPIEQFCDSVHQCADSSDEWACEKCQQDVAFHCDMVRCIPKRLKCDNCAHCTDGTDEESCGGEVFETCQDVWKAGYRKSGHYMMGDLQALCKFDDGLKNDAIFTVLNFDFRYRKDEFVGTISITPHFYNIPSTEEENSMTSVIFNKDNISCVQQVKVVCDPSIENRIHVVDTSKKCKCGILNFKINPGGDTVKQNSIEKCQNFVYNNWTVTFEKSVLTRSEITYWSRKLFGGVEDILGRSYQIMAGSAICEQDYQADDNDFNCEINGKYIPTYLRCVYDIDETGFPIGCRDGSHLNNCEKYECPRNAVKCPDSYCIPLRFLCDGVLQCPGGEDEENCGCHPSKNEILIIHDDESVDGPDITQFARQFYTRTNIVRLLGYRASRPLQLYGISNMLLEIRDREINHVQDIESLFECRYKIMAGRLLESVQFTHDEIKGVILIQSSEISKEVVSEILQKVSVLEPDFRIYRVTKNFDTSITVKSLETRVTEIRVKRWRILDGIGAEYFNEICNVTTKLQCHGGYKCASSKTCIPMEEVCDGFIQCLHGDDEALCDFQCPSKCKCVGLISNCSATDFNLTMMHTIPKKTRYLDFSLNRKLSPILQESVLKFSTLSILNLSGCSIEMLSRYAFHGIRNLRSLDISFNSISIISNYVFNSLKHLTHINLRGNFHLSIIEVHAFAGLVLIKDLDLANANLVKVLADTFAGMTLKKLDLSNNKLEELENFAFRASSIEHINFRRNNLKIFSTEIFTGLVGLKKMFASEFKFCCIRPIYVPEENCYPHKDEFSSCDDLMRHSVLQFLIWLIGITAFLGNVLSVFYRLKYDRKRLKLGFGIFVTNLAVADFLMAVYLLIIAAADSSFRNRYIFVDEYWRHSVLCNLAGILSTTSSESSVLFLCLITLDRLLVIKFPFGRAKLSKYRAVACVIFTWLFSASVAILPVAYKGYFRNEFYSKSGVCIALPLTRDRPPGWAYSLTIFVCLNFVTFLLVAIGQLSIFVEIRKSSGIATSVETARKRDLKVARNLLLVVATDFMCWFPIGVMALLALTGHVIPGDVYAWTAVFILPVNSALNPILYTLSAIIGGKRFNPSTDEQSLKGILKEIGENSIKCFTASRRFATRNTLLRYRDVREVTGEEVHVTVNAILMIAAQLAHTLDAFHSCSLGIKSLDGTTVMVGIRYNKLTGAVKIKGEPFISYKQEDKIKSMNQLGLILRSLIVTREKRLS